MSYVRIPDWMYDAESDRPISDREMRANDENYWDCPGCGDPGFYMGDPACGRCGWNGK